MKQIYPSEIERILSPPNCAGENISDSSEVDLSEFSKEDESSSSSWTNESSDSYIDEIVRKKSNGKADQKSPKGKKKHHNVKRVKRSRVTLTRWLKSRYLRAHQHQRVFNVTYHSQMTPLMLVWYVSHLRHVLINLGTTNNHSNAESETFFVCSHDVSP